MSNHEAFQDSSKLLIKYSRVETHANPMKIMGNPGCRCRSKRYWQWGPWPRSWKSRPGIYQNPNSFSWRIFTFQGMTPYQLADRKGHAMVLGWSKPVPWHCSWSVQFHSFGENLYQVVDMTDMMSILCILYTCYLQELEDLLQVSGSLNWQIHLRSPVNVMSLRICRTSRHRMWPNHEITCNLKLLVTRNKQISVSSSKIFMKNHQCAVYSLVESQQV